MELQGQNIIEISLMTSPLSQTRNTDKLFIVCCWIKRSAATCAGEHDLTKHIY